MENYIKDCLKGLKAVEIENKGQFDFYFKIKPLNDSVLSEMKVLFDIDVYKDKTYNKTENYLIGFNKFWNEFYIVDINLFESYLNSIYKPNTNNNQMYINTERSDLLPTPLPINYSNDVGAFNLNGIACKGVGYLITKR